MCYLALRDRKVGVTPMNNADEIIEGLAPDVIPKLTQVPPGEHVRVRIGRPSFSAIARGLQATAAANGMTDAIHDELIRSLKDPA